MERKVTSVLLALVFIYSLFPSMHIARASENILPEQVARDYLEIIDSREWFIEGRDAFSVGRGDHFFSGITGDATLLSIDLIDFDKNGVDELFLCWYQCTDVYTDTDDASIWDKYHSYQNGIIDWEIWGHDGSSAILIASNPHSGDSSTYGLGEWLRGFSISFLEANGRIYLYNYVQFRGAVGGPQEYSYYTVSKNAQVKRTFNIEISGSGVSHYLVDSNEVPESTFLSEKAAFDNSQLIDPILDYSYWDDCYVNCFETPALKYMAALRQLYSALSSSELLTRMGYEGDIVKCQMSAEQATSFADTLAEELSSYQNHMATGLYAEYYPNLISTHIFAGQGVLFDTGNGIPALIFCKGIYDVNETAYYADEYSPNYTQYVTGVQVKVIQYAEGNTQFFAQSVDGLYKNNASVHLISDHGGWDDFDYAVFPVVDGYISLTPTETATGIWSLDDWEDIVINGKTASSKQLETWEQTWLNEPLFRVYYSGDISWDAVNGGVSLYDLIPLLYAYAEVNNVPTFNFASPADKTNLLPRLAELLGCTTDEIVEVYELWDGLYLVVYTSENGYSSAVVKEYLSNGERLLRIMEQWDSAPKQDEVSAHITQHNATPNLNIDYEKVSSFVKLDEFTSYLSSLLNNIDGITPNDLAKNDLASYIDHAVSSLSSGLAIAVNNQLKLTGDLLTAAKTNATTAWEQLKEILTKNEVSLNKDTSITLRMACLGIDPGSAMSITLDQSLADSLGDCSVLLALGDNSHAIRLSPSAVQTIVEEYGSATIHLAPSDANTYNVTFLNSEGTTIDQLPAPITFVLPAADKFSTILASYFNGNDNWGGQYDEINSTIQFDTPYSGQYEIIENNVNISDISGLSDEFQNAISFMVSKGYFTLENDAFRPSDTLTRYDFTQTLVSMFFALDRNLTTSFTDVPESSPYYAYVASAQAGNIVNGVSEGIFAGDSNITREQVAAITARTLIDAKGYHYPENADAYLSFSDTGEIGSWAKNDIALAVQNGIVSGGSTFAPKRDITRAEAALILYRMFMRLYETPPAVVELPQPESVVEPEPVATEEGIPTTVLVCLCVGAGVAIGGVGVLLIGKKRTNAK